MAAVGSAYLHSLDRRVGRGASRFSAHARSPRARMGALTGAAANAGRRARTHTRGHAVLIDAPAATPSIELVDLTGSDWTAGGVVGLGRWCAAGAGAAPPGIRGGAAASSCSSPIVLRARSLQYPGQAVCSAQRVGGGDRRRRVPRRVMGTLVADTSRPTCLPSPARTHARAHALVPHVCRS
jgi:hypothetical protein